MARFSALKTTVFKHHVYHAIHHDHTIKTPRPAHGFSQKPPKNATIHHAIFFLPLTWKNPGE
jgi:hypothetical protein